MNWRRLLVAGILAVSLLPRPEGGKSLSSRPRGRYPGPETGMGPVHLGNVGLGLDVS